jgi:D-sedoheptulose 7-phosphate isomerase
VTFPSEIDAFIATLEATKERFADGRLNKAFEILRAAVPHYPIMICGNGGSAADAQHIAAELVGRFLTKHREPINAISLSADTSVLTAWANDTGYDAVFARQVKAHGWRGQGALICISTSGSSESVIRAALAAIALEIPVIGLTGDGGGRLVKHCDVLLDVPSRETPIIQQLHQCLYHYLCGRLEEAVSKART